MNDFDRTLIVTELEFLALAALKGVKNIVGLFETDKVDFDNGVFSSVLFSLNRKNLVDVDGSSIKIQPEVSEIMEVFKNEPITVVISPTAAEKPQLCCTCADKKVVCTQKIPTQPGKLKLCITDSLRLGQYLLEDGFLDEIPKAELQREPFICDRNELNASNIIRIERIISKEIRLIWTIDYILDGCFITDADGETVPCCCQEVADLIVSLTES